MDNLYGGGEAVVLENLKDIFKSPNASGSSLLRRVGLHASSITFQHPEFIQPGDRKVLGDNTNELYFLANCPEDIQSAVTALRKFSKQQ